MISKALRSIFELDTRALALSRMVMGALIILATVQLFPLARAFYSDAGFLPRTALLQHLNREGAINFYLFGGGMAWTYFLLGSTLLAALAFTLGFHTRLATLILWLLITSLHNRNPEVLDGGDVMFRVLLFWALFLPMGARWSLDARRAAGLPLFFKNRKPDESAATAGSVLFFGIGSVAFMLQVALIYIITSQTKTGLPWHTHGTAVQLALLNPAFATPVGSWFVKIFEPMLEFMTYATIWAELLLPLLLFSPWKTHLVRLVGMMGLTALHIGIDVTMSVGYTSVGVFSGLLAFTPPAVFDTVRRLPAMKARLIMPSEDPPVQHITGMRPRWAEVLCAYCLVWILVVNVNTISYPGSRELLQMLPSFPRNVLRLDQKWSMFSPYPPLDQSYILARGHLHNGTVVNMRTRELLQENTNLPVYMPYFDSHRWRKYYENFNRDNLEPIRPYYGAYLAAEWNADRPATSPERVKAVTIWHVFTPLLKDNAETSWTQLLHYDVEAGIPMTTATTSLVEMLPR